EVEPGQVIGNAALPAGAGLGLEPVDQVYDVEEAAACAVADEGPGNGDRQMRLASARPADQHDIALIGDEGATGKVADQGFVDRRAGEVEVLDVLGQRQLGDGELVFDGTGLLLRYLGLQQIADDLRRLVLPLDGDAHDLVIGRSHPVELQRSHQVQYFGAFHGCLSS